MKIAERLQTVTRVFLDTAPVIYYVETNPRYRQSLKLSLTGLILDEMEL